VSSDEALVAAIASGESDALDVLIERHWESAFRLSLRFGLDPGAAEDTAQESFVALFAAAERFDPRRNFKSWFFQIVRNAARQRLRGERRRQAREERAARPEVTWSEEDPLAAAELQAALGRLRPERREVIALHYFGGLTLREVAKATETKKGTVDSRLSRGLEDLRQDLSLTASLAGPLMIALLRQALVAAPAPPAAAAVVAAAGGAAGGAAVGAGKALGPLFALIVAGLLALGARATLSDPDSGAETAEATSTPTAKSDTRAAPRNTRSGAPPEKEPEAAGDPRGTGTRTSPTSPERVAASPAAQPRPSASSAPPAASGAVDAPALTRASAGLDLRFVDAEGQPIPGVVASVKQRSDAAMGVGGGRPLVRHDAPRSDAHGWLRVDTDLRGDLEVKAFVSGYLQADLYPIKPRRTRRLVRVVALDRARTLRGVVVNGAGQGVAKAYVRAGGVAATTGPDGRFQLEGLPSRVRLSARFKAGQAKLEVGPSETVVRLVLVGSRLRFRLDVGERGPRKVLVSIGGSTHRIQLSAEPIEVPVAAGSHRLVVIHEETFTVLFDRGVELPAEGGVVDLGTLREASAQVSGRILSGGGPLAGASVDAYRGSPLPVSESSGADGAFKLQVEPGKCRLEVSHPDHLTWRGPLEVTAAGLHVGDVSLERGVRWALRLESANKGAVWVRSLSLTHVRGEKEEEFSYSAGKGMEPSPLAEEVPYLRPVLTLYALPRDRRTRLWVSMRGYAPSAVELEGSPSAEPRVVVMRSGGSVALRLTRASGQPARYAQVAIGPPELVRARRADRFAWREADSRGRVVLDRLPAGRWPVFRLTPGGVTEIGSVEVSEQELVRVELLLP
jgi:RNA polymerase sigma factor (sigma-70 family)